MKVIIYQRGGDKDNLPLYKKAIEFFADELMSTEQQENIKIAVKIKKLVGEYKTFAGTCEEIKSHSYLIEAKKGTDFESMITILAHEMIHVRQMEEGKLKFKNNGAIWKGKLYKNIDIENAKDYTKLKWEIESYTKEHDLAEKFLINCDKTEV